MFSKAMKLLDSGNAVAAEEIGKYLLNSEKIEEKASGHFCLGLVYEFGGIDFPINLELAASHYRQLVLMARDSLSHCLLSRVLLKMGGVGHDQALAQIKEAQKIEVIPEIYICLGNYFITTGNVRKAKINYAKAAFRGRFQGFFEYSRICRDEGKAVRAFFVDLIRILLGPFFFLIFGTAAADIF